MAVNKKTIQSSPCPFFIGNDIVVVTFIKKHSK